MMEKSNRLHDLQIMKVVAVFCVVYGHVILPFTNYSPAGGQIVPLYNGIMNFLAHFHTPCFTYCSGFIFGFLLSLGKYNNGKEFFFNKFKRLLKPWLVYGIISCLVYASNPVILLQSGFHVWYLLMLFECFFITWIYDKYASSSRRDVILLVCCLLLTIKSPASSKWFSIAGLISQYPFFFVGYYLSKKNVFEFISTQIGLKKVLSMFVFVVVFVMTVAGISGYYFEVDCGVILWVKRLCMSFIFVLFIVNLHALLRFVRIERMLSVIEFLDRYSYRIYLIHPFIISLLIYYFPINQNFLLLFFRYFFVLLSSLLFAFLIEKSFFRKLL